MRAERGYTLLELIVVVAFIGVASAIAYPIFQSSDSLNDLWTSSERMGSLIRQTRFKAISQNATYQVRFDCPAAGDVRALVMTGVAATDDAPGRCSGNQPGDSDIVEMEAGVDFDPGTATALQVTGRGVFTALGAAIPLTIGVTHGSTARYLIVSATGQISFSSTDPTP
jgi:prepilin-type N-terminal cleavage/methylation domain-containing protein